MATCGRRIRPKLLLGFLIVSLLGYFLFHKTSTDVSRANRRELLPGEMNEKDYELLKKAVYEKPPLDVNALGELGVAVQLDLTGVEKRKEEESIDKHQINIYVSDKISLHRRLPERWNTL